jgi:peptide/nickel transport system substrate-binding protein
MTISRDKAIVVCLLIALLVVAGCAAPAPQSQPAETQPTTEAQAQPAESQPTTAPAAEPAATGEPVEGGTITIPIIDDPTFNPHHPNHFVESVMVTRVLFNGLTKPGKDLKPSPDLAADWEVSDDGLTWTFMLRDDVTWHDGEPFTADDVVFTFQDVVLDPDVGAGTSRNFAQVESVEKVDDYTVRFNLKEPFASLPAYLGYNAGILPEHILAGTDVMANTDFNKQNPVGTGAFKLAEYVSGQNVRLVRNDDYFLGKPHLDAIVYEIIPEVNTQIAELLAGTLDLMIVDNPSTVERLEQDEDIRIETTSQVNYFWVAPNTTQERFQDKRVRQALSYAVDRDAMIQALYRGYATPATGPISPALSFYYTDDVMTYSYDPEKAKELLREAGWEENSSGVFEKNGEPLALTITVPRTGVFEQLGALLQQYYKDIGIDADLLALEFNTFVSEALLPRKFDVMAGWWITPPDPDVFPYYHSSAAEGGNNVPMYANDRLDELLVEGLQKSDPEERRAVYQEIQRLLAEEVPYIFLWYPQEIRAVNKNLKGIPEIGYRDALQYTDEWYLEQ